MTPQQAMAGARELHRAGRLGEAERAYRHVLAQSPQLGEAWLLLGILASQTGRFEMAVEMIQRAIAVQPGAAMYHVNLGIVLYDMGRIDEAIAAYRNAVQVQPDLAEAYNNLGNILRGQGKLAEAIECLSRTVELRPGVAEIRNNLGIALRDAGRARQALEEFSKAAALKPGLADTYNNLGNALSDLARIAEAMGAYRRAIQLRGDYAEAHNNLGNVMAHDGHWDQAMAEFARAIALKPELADAHNNLGNALMSLGRAGESPAAYEKAIQLQPDLADAHFNLGQLLLMLGDFERGWAEYEWRQKTKAALASRPPLARPQWDGQALAGKTVLLHAEQGLGDCLQMVRYLPMAAERGARVILECPMEMKELLAGIGDVQQLIGRGEALPQFDLHCPLLSLPLVFGTRVETIPAKVPYLTAERGKRFEEPGPHVGLVWAGNPRHQNDRNRSMALKELLPLAELAACYHTLQLGRAAEQIHDAPKLKLVEHSAQMRDFAETARVVAGLDLIITVDTAMAHLAGAMGKETWLMLPFAPDWRWMLGREDSPWYPTMRLFRQTRPGDWAGVVDRVAHALRQR